MTQKGESMMSLTNAKLSNVVRRQFGFKLKANIDAFNSLVGIQTVALLFSIGGVGAYGMSSDYVSINVKSFSADLVIIFTMIWGFASAITITTRPYRHHDFTFVTNRLSSSLSNILFLLAASILGGVTATLSGYLLRVVGYFLNGPSIYSPGISVGELFLGIIVTSLYVFLASSLGYLCGTFAQVSKFIIIALPSLLIGILFVDFTINRNPMVGEVYQFYFSETSLGLFFVKTILTSVVLFAASTNILNRLEVKR
jgi:hypothetical protein